MSLCASLCPRLLPLYHEPTFSATSFVKLHHNIFCTHSQYSTFPTFKPYNVFSSLYTYHVNGGKTCTTHILAVNLQGSQAHIALKLTLSSSGDRLKKEAPRIYKCCSLEGNDADYCALNKRKAHSKRPFRGASISLRCEHYIVKILKQYFGTELRNKFVVRTSGFA